MTQVGNYRLRLLIFTILLCSSIPLSVAAQEAEPDSITARNLLMGMSPGQKLYTLRKFRFIDQVMNGISWNEIAINSNPSVFQFQPETQYTDSTLQQRPGLLQDPLAGEIARRYLQAPPTVPITNLIEGIASAIRESRHKRARRNLAVPSAAEVAVLKVMWDKAYATSGEIYSLMDSLAIASVTSEDLRFLLAEMTDQGLLERRQISPSNEFSVFGLWKFEMSRNNVRNREYLYWPTVSREALIAYLDVRRYWAIAQREAVGRESKTEIENRLYQIVK